MSTFETLATVGDKEEVRVDGVPFAPGTAVDVIIQPIQISGPDEGSTAESREQAVCCA